MNDPRIIVALDFPDASQALGLTAKLDPSSCRLKVGKELFTAAGPQLVEKMISKGFEIFLDLKFHDIPNTVAKALKPLCELPIDMINVHAAGGSRGGAGAGAGGVSAPREGGAAEVCAAPPWNADSAADVPHARRRAHRPCGRWGAAPPSHRRRPSPGTP